MDHTHIVAAVRTPIGKFGGQFVDVSPVDLAAHVMKAALVRAGVSSSDLDLYIFGNILKHGHGQLLPRQAALRSGIPEQVDGYAVDMLCSSGMMATFNGDMAIRSGEADLVLAGGVESMSQAGFMISHRARWGYKLLAGGGEALSDVLLDDGLRDPMTQELMGEETERLAQTHGISRRELDEVACLSHQRAAAATAGGKSRHEIAPLEVQQRKGLAKIETDEGIRPETSIDGLGMLRSAFAGDGVLTAGNSSQLSDGAAALLLASQRAVERLGLRPIARILGGAWSATEPWRFVEAPIPAIRRLLSKLEMGIGDFDLFENNEAFALNTVLLRRALNIPDEVLNIYGGAIALGHPVGASGARILVTLLNALQQEGKTLGMASLCHGTGGGTALAVELVDSN